MWGRLKSAFRLFGDIIFLSGWLIMIGVACLMDGVDWLLGMHGCHYD